MIGKARRPVSMISKTCRQKGTQSAQFSGLIIKAQFSGLIIKNKELSVMPNVPEV